MAIASSRTRVLQGEDHAIAVKTDTIIDPQSGVAVQVEKAVIAVDLGDGRVAMHEEQRVIGAAIPVEQPQSRPAITYNQPRSTPSSYSVTPQSSGTDSSDTLVHLCCCLMCVFFPPVLLCWLVYCCVKD